VAKADLSKQPGEVSAMFDGVAKHYDRTNDVLSLGNAWIWRAATVKAVAPKAGEKILDLAAGTGTSSAALAKSGADVTAADFSPGMIEVGRRKHPGITFVEADAMNLPFADNEFDAVTISFGLRNIEDPKKALSEMFRVLKPGGRLVVCEFSKPPRAIFRAGYTAYMRFIMPAVVDAASSDRLLPTVIVGRGAASATPAAWVSHAGRVIVGVERGVEVSEAFRTEVSPHAFVIDEGGFVAAQGGPLTLDAVRSLIADAEGLRIVTGAADG